MSNQTAGEWLRSQGLSITDIDFIETILVATSTAKGFKSKLDEVNLTVQKSFPDKKVEIDSNLTFWQFEKLLHDNEVYIDINELLIRYRKQGFCAELCKQLLDSWSVK
ncbi:hypothetical protein [Pseudalkalibacillus sp. NRS-1564]|uniref:hypothetical protein n=1 Tax=Pseudalkalibacillus sp. NRS-1564 TaxID=3233900 RepID=UPI003D29F93F